ncbi:ABC transporter ATP-binding protein [Streptomyces sp. TRM66268-LWL]|uniref:ABC transporter ATP-binding protein n=1 Tax=Streptomyces polyasparticus TaxID=2767826 RepID=A0ABR7SE24_9ACTN|nr:ABC transporter ATP-binding protein [Streptomyces polyasparticus]MBC9713752.1 ABC transporter ATP-binding protein [Streptomyces polyasparticus]
MTAEALTAPTAARPVLRVRGLGWAVGGARIVSGLEFDVAEGEFVAVIGPNGAGKTSLFNLISGLVRPTEGSIELDRADITADPPHRRARRGLGRTFQSSSVFAGLSVLENVRLAAAAHRGSCLRLWRRADSGTAAREAAMGALARVGLSTRAADLAGALSHGDKRKLEIAILLVTEPRLILLDEPMAGVGTADVPALTEVIRTVHREEGRTVLMVEHHMDVLLGLADRVAVMHHGQLLALDTPEKVTADPLVQDAYLGETL